MLQMFFISSSCYRRRYAYHDEKTTRTAYEENIYQIKVVFRIIKIKCLHTYRYRVYIMIDVDSILLATRTTFFIMWQFICYQLGRKRFDCVKNIAEFLSSYNIVYSKIFQSLSSGADVLTHEEMDYLSRFNDNVPYHANELYSIDELETIINEGQTADQLLTIDRSRGGQPFASGMIAVVYYGELEKNKLLLK